MCTSSCRGRGQKRALDSLELELQLSITQVPPTCLPSSSPYSFFHTGSQVVQAELTMDVKVTLYVVLGNSRPCACWHGLHVLKCIPTLTSEPLSNHSIALIPNHTVDSSLWRTSLSRSTSTAAPASASFLHGCVQLQSLKSSLQLERYLGYFTPAFWLSGLMLL